MSDKKKTETLYVDIEKRKMQIEMERVSAEAKAQKALYELAQVEEASHQVGVDLLEFGSNYRLVLKHFKEHGVTEKSLKTARVLYGVKSGKP